MNLAICPSCGSHLEPRELVNRIGFYCDACGWNSSSTRRSAGRQLLIITIGILATGSLLIFNSLLSRNRPDSLIPLLEFGVIFAVSAWRGSLALRNLLRSPNRLGLFDASGVSRAPEAFQRLMPDYGLSERLFADVLRLPKPRPLRASRLILISCFTMLISLASIALYSYAILNASRKTHLELLGRVSLVLLVASILIALAASNPLRQARLMRGGEIAVGRLVLQENFTLRSVGSFLHYAFVDSTGRGFFGEGRDFLENVDTGAPLVVFYDRF